MASRFKVPLWPTLLCFQIAVALLHAQPDNDNFANAIPLSGSNVEFALYTGNATLEQGEPDHTAEVPAFYVPVKESVWFTWQAPRSGIAKFLHFSTGPGSLPLLYTGTSLTNLNLMLPRFDLSGSLFTVQAGTTYHIAFIGVQSGQYTAESHVQLRLFPFPTNDSFANAAPLSESQPFESFLVPGTLEPGEPPFPDAVGSLWWAWTPSATGTANLFFNSSFLPGESWLVFEGNALSNLKPVQTSSSDYYPSLIFSARANVPYRIAWVTSNQSALSSTVIQPIITPLAISSANPDATVLSGDSIMLHFDVPQDPATNQTVTLEVLSVNPAYLLLSKQWTPPFPDSYLFTNAPAGTLKFRLSLRNQPSIPTPPSPLLASQSISFPTPIPTQVLYSAPAIVNVRHRYDNFSDARALVGSDLQSTLDLRGSTIEPNEPLLIDTNVQHSVWFKWTSPETGSLFLSGFSLNLELFSGSSLPNLQPVTGESFNEFPSAKVFFVQSGTTYFLRASAAYPADYSFHLQLIPGMDFRLPGNDAFENAIDLSTGPLALMPYLSRATIEPAEPNQSSLKTVWYKFHSNTQGVFFMDASYFGARMQAFTGNSLQSLLSVAEPNVRLRLEVMPGEMYFIQMTPEPQYAPGRTFSYHFDPHPVNDSFSSPLLLTLPTDTTVSFLGASIESNEPPNQFPGDDVTLWYTIVPSRDGYLYLSDSPRFSLWTGQSLQTLQPVLPHLQNSHLFRVLEGVAYRLRLERGYTIDSATVHLSLHFFEDQPAGDISPEPLFLDSLSRRLVLPVFLATTSPTDPPVQLPDGIITNLLNTLWFYWTAPADGAIILSANSSLWIGIFDGDSITNSNLLKGTFGSLSFHTAKDQTYQILIGSNDSNPFTRTKLSDFFASFSTLHFTSPPTNAIFRITDPITIAVSDPVPALDRSLLDLRFFASSSKGTFIDLGILTNTPFQVVTNLPIGQYQIGAYARTTAEEIIPIEPVSITVRDFSVTNDSFAQPRSLQGQRIVVSLTTNELNSATFEPGEPSSNNRILIWSSSGTLWYRWTAPVDGLLSATSAPYWGNDGVLWEGDDLSSLSPVTYITNQNRFVVQRGHEYKIQLYVGTTYPWILDLDCTTAFQIISPATNSQFSVAQPITFKVATSEPATNISSFSFYWNKVMAGVAATPPWEITSTLPHPGVGSVSAVLSTTSGQTVTNSGPTIYITPANSSPDNAVVLSTNNLDVAFPGFRPPAPGSNHLIGPPLYFRYTPARPEFIFFASADLSVSTIAGDTLHPIAFAGPVARPDVYKLDAGTEYLLIVSNPGPGAGFFEIDLPPPNDNFVDALPFPRDDGDELVSAFLGTIEPGEPPTPFGSIWYRWRAPADGLLKISEKLFQGATLPQLSEVPSLPDDLSLYPVKANTEYRVAVYSSVPIGLFKLSWHFYEGAVGEDFFANAPLISSGPNSTIYLRHTYEPGEPTYGNSFGYGSIWWKWIPTESGRTYISPRPTSRDDHGQYRLILYSGTSVASLSPIEPTYTLYNEGWFDTTAGQTYYLMYENLSSFSSNPSEVPLVLRHYTPPLNDDLASAQQLVGNQLSVGGSTTLASRQFGEPLHAGHYGGRSLWYHWQSPADGLLTLHLHSDPPLDFYPGIFGNPATADQNPGPSNLLAAYKGTTLPSLIPVASNSSPGTNTLTFQVLAGQTYTIAADFMGPPTDFLLDLQFTPDPLALTLQAITADGATITINNPSKTTLIIQSSTNLLDWNDSFILQPGDPHQLSLPFDSGPKLFLRARTDHSIDY